MNSRELLDILGDVDEGFVLAADEKVVRPRFRWQPWAAAAACVALVCVAAWPRFGGGSNGSAAGGVTADSAPEAAPGEPDTPAGAVVQSPGLHGYTLIEGEGRPMVTADERKAAAEGVDDAAPDEVPAAEPAPAPNDPIAGAAPAPDKGTAAGPFENATAADMPQDVDGVVSSGFGEGAAIDQEEAARQYQNLLSSGGIGYGGEGYYPSWFGGAWLDNDWPDNTARLTVAMVEGWDTEAMEGRVRDWCGGTGDVLFCTVKYSYAQLNGLMDEISALFDQYGWLSSSFCTSEENNRVELDIFEMPGDELLADLARLDPDGDAIFVRVFTDGRGIRPTDGAAG